MHNFLKIKLFEKEKEKEASPVNSLGMAETIPKSLEPPLFGLGVHSATPTSLKKKKLVLGFGPWGWPNPPPRLLEVVLATSILLFWGWLNHPQGPWEWLGHPRLVMRVALSAKMGGLPSIFFSSSFFKKFFFFIYIFFKFFII
jgi:hypothetical protein